MTATTGLRRAANTDLQVVHQIRREAILGIAPECLSQAATEEWAEMRTPEYFAPRVADNAIWLAVDEEGTPIAWGASVGNRVEGIYVRPEFGRTGIGRNLMEKLEEDIRTRGHGDVRLAASLNAVGFYSKLGYATVRTSKDNLTIPMTKDLA